MRLLMWLTAWLLDRVQLCRGRWWRTTPQTEPFQRHPQQYEWSTFLKKKTVHRNQSSAYNCLSAGNSSYCEWFEVCKLPSATNTLMRRQTPVESRAPISPGLLPILSMNKYAPVFVGNSMAANMSCVRYMFTPNSDMLRHIPKYVIWAPHLEEKRKNKNMISIVINMDCKTLDRRCVAIVCSLLIKYSLQAKSKLAYQYPHWAQKAKENISEGESTLQLVTGATFCLVDLGRLFRIVVLVCVFLD